MLYGDTLAPATPHFVPICPKGLSEGPNPAAGPGTSAFSRDLVVIKRPKLFRPKRRDAATSAPFSDPACYRSAYPDVAAGGGDPLRHYLDHG